jgi:hypothetical protein
MVKMFVESKCPITLRGRTFTSGGAWLLKRKDTGRCQGVLYAYEKEGKIGNWKGDWKVPANFGKEWRGSMGDMRQTVTAKIDGKKFSGTYYKSAGDLVRLKEVI